MKTVICFATILLLTIITTLSLFPKNKEISLGDLGGSFSEERSLLIESPRLNFRNILADSIQVPLSLKWYDLYFENNSEWVLNNCPVLPTSPYIEILFREDIPHKYGQTTFEEPIQRQGWYIFRIDRSEIKKFVFPGNKVLIYHTRFGPDTVSCSINNNRDSIQDHKLQEENINLIVYAKSNPTVWWTKFIIIFIFWTVLFASIINIIQFCKRSRK